MAEFALVIPILLILLLTVADFGRYFATAISLESMARTAAEVAAQEYVQEVATSVEPKNYALIHRMAWQSVCDEGHDLPNSTPGSGGGECVDLPTMVCVHDGIDPTCGATYNEGAGVPTECAAVLSPPSPTVDSQLHAYVEVRVCYRFSSVFQLTIPLLDLNIAPLSGNFFIERARSFTVADY
ncbi:MAG: TadE/TadG family type IV pilus assembly protein [Chloroflexota bacterium]